MCLTLSLSLSRSLSLSLSRSLSCRERSVTPRVASDGAFSKFQRIQGHPRRASPAPTQLTLWRSFQRHPCLPFTLTQSAGFSLKASARALGKDTGRFSVTPTVIRGSIFSGTLRRDPCSEQDFFVFSPKRRTKKDAQEVSFKNETKLQIQVVLSHVN